MSKSLSRQEKLDKISGEKYPRSFPNRISINILLRYHNSSTTTFDSSDNITGYELDKGYLKQRLFKIAGRIMSRRNHGNNIFFNLMDQTGVIQLHAHLWTETDKNTDGLRLNIWNKIQECDLGDMIGVEGTLAQNPRGEPLLQISNWTLLAKALIEPPDKKHGITEAEVKYRHRERDLISSAESRALFKTRAEIVFEIRKYLNERDFIEIETPVLQSIYGGATARPFITRHHALNQDFYLAISSELFLKRAMVGGYDRVYSINRCFRNEGISPEHNPEFTNLEIFETCKTAQDMKKFTEDLIEYTAHSVGSLIPTKKEFKKNMPSSDWPLSRKFNDNCPNDTNNDGDCGKINCPYCGNINFRYADAWELYIDGMEIASGASDLNDPREQESRLLISEGEAATSDIKEHREEYDPYDQNYIEALEMGVLPWAGVGIGIDRLVMLLLGKNNIRDVITFPTLRSNVP